MTGTPTAQRDQRLRRHWPRHPSAGDRLAAAVLGLGTLALAVGLRARFAKPFWYDEQWRARQVAAPGTWLGHLDRSDGPVALGWFLLERAALMVFGDSEATLRLPMLLALPALSWATYRLVRCWSPPATALVAAALVYGNAAMLTFGTQLKPFAFEALCAVLMLQVWLRSESAGRGHRRLADYALLGGLAVCAVPTVFVLGPLLVLGAVRALRRRDLQATLALSAVAGVPTLLHLVLFVLPQSRLRQDPFYDQDYLPHAPGAALRFLGHRLAEWVPGTVTGFLRYDSTVTSHVVAAPGRTVNLLLAAALLLALALGGWRLRAGPDGRALLTAVGGAFAAVLAASAVRTWPFGFERVNLFLVPLLLAVAAAGVRPQRRPAPMVVTCLLTAAAVLAVCVSAQRAERLHRLGQRHTGELLELTNAAVREVRSQAQPGDVAVVRPYFAGAGWLYYMVDNAVLRRVGRPVAPERTLVESLSPTGLLNDPGAADVAGFLARQRPERVWLFQLPRPRMPSSATRLAEMRRLGFCRVQSWTYVHTGTLSLLDRCR